MYFQRHSFMNKIYLQQLYVPVTFHNPGAVLSVLFTLIA